MKTMKRRIKEETPQPTSLRLENIHSPNHMIYSMTRRSVIGAGVAQQGEILELEDRVDGTWYRRYYRVISAGPVDYTNGKHVYEAMKIKNKREAETALSQR